MRGPRKSLQPVPCRQCTVDEQISFVLSHPGMSAWLKNALRTALDRDPAEVLNDLEILNLISRLRLSEDERLVRKAVRDA